MPLVVDASLVLAWHFADEATDATEALRTRCEGEVLHVPSHWRAEVSNGILVGERRRRATEAQGERFVAWLGLLALAIDDHGAIAALTILLPLARRHRLTVYDAAYLELALRRGLPLATLHDELAAASRAAGVALLEI